MKIGYIGGGSFRVLAEVRVLLAQTDLKGDWEIALYDLDPERVQAMAELIRKSPEARQTGARVVIASSLDQAVEGADFVEVTACPWSGTFYGRCSEVSHRHGLVTSDNVSVTGAFLALHSAGLALKVARRMEALAPRGTLICFTNPIALLAGAVNRGTRIRAVGICGGQANYVHNVAYIMGWPDYDWDLTAEAAGINHISWLMGLKLRGRDFMPDFTRQLEAGIDYDRLKHIGNYQELCVQFPRMVYAWKTFGVIHYSIEPEGLPILSFYDEELARQCPKNPPPPPPPVAKRTPGRTRPQHVEEFLRLASTDIPAELWQSGGPGWLQAAPFRSATGARIIKGLSTRTPEELVTSYLNQGAVAGFPDDAMMEYTTRYVDGRIEKKATYRLPPVVNGLTHMLVEHQTLVMEAIVHEDPDLFRRAIYAYPLCRSRQSTEGLIKEIVAANREELPAFMLKQ
jgi:6-phospho-beta-glucosidase